MGKNSYFLLKKSEDILNLITKLYFYVLNLYLFSLKNNKKEIRINGLVSLPGWVGPFNLWVKLVGLKTD